MKHIIAPSILAADFGNLNNDIQLIHNSLAEWVHIDVMDGHFVPNISFGFPILEVCRKQTDKFLDVHLMISNPVEYIDEFAKKGADGITIHLETVRHLDMCIKRIKEVGCKAAVAINPHTSAELLNDILPQLDMVLVMTVNPGFGGQKFLPYCLDKVKIVRSRIQELGLKTKIQVDGGIGLPNYQQALTAGADVLVSGSAVFKSENPINTIAQLSEHSAKNIVV